MPLTPRGASPAKQPGWGCPRKAPNEANDWKSKWNRWEKMVSDDAIGGHCDSVVPTLPSDNLTLDAQFYREQQLHDSLHCDQLMKKRPDEPAHPAAGQEMPGQFTAFADRALRQREGRLMQVALEHPDPGPTEWQGHGKCDCAVCAPHCQKAAGAPSYAFCQNKVHRLEADVPPSPRQALSPRHCQNSSQVAAVIVHQESPAPASPEHELQLTQGFGRRARSPTPSSLPSGMLPHRGFVVDSTAAAGQFDAERYSVMPVVQGKARMAWQPKPGEASPRSGVALVLTPRADDPEPPNRIAQHRKGDGLFKNGYSDEADKHAVYQNQAQFRFADPLTPRSRALAPLIDPKEYAGTPTGAPAHHLHDQSNPLTMEGKSPRSLTLHVDRKGTHHASPSMSLALNHESLNRSSQAERTWRLQNDEAFAKLCSHTAEVRQAARANADANKGSNGHYGSDYIRTQLVWAE